MYNCNDSVTYKGITILDIVAHLEAGFLGNLPPSFLDQKYLAFQANGLERQCNIKAR